MAKTLYIIAAGVATVAQLLLFIIEYPTHISSFVWPLMAGVWAYVYWD